MKPYADLTPGEKSAICNGCGAKGYPIKVPDFIFIADCNLHDYNYTVGGIEADRLKYDKGFYKAMLIDASKEHSTLLKQYYRFWAWTYYTVVRTFGSKYFNYTG